MRIPEYDEPEPDVSILRGADDDYYAPKAWARRRGASGRGLRIDAGQDRGEKLPAYARARIPVYWIVNLVERQVEVYTIPGIDGYSNRQDFSRASKFPSLIDGQQVGQIAVDDILPLLPVIS